MELSSFCSLCIFLFSFLFLQTSNCQQYYLNNRQLDCLENPSISKGYLCNGIQTSCVSFLTFISSPPYDSPTRIARLLGSEPSSIALINNISSINNINPSQKLIIVPISCSCTGSIYQHKAPYTVQDKSETYFSIANNTYQGLTTCQALMGQNYYDYRDLEVGLELMIPLRCACPSSNQTASGVISLLAYMVTWGDTISSIGERFGVDEASILEANKLSMTSIIFPFTPILVPFKTESCLMNPTNFFCKCYNGYLADGGLEGTNCIKDRQKFPVKLVILLGDLSLPRNQYHGQLFYILGVVQVCSTKLCYPFIYFRCRHWHGTLVFIPFCLQVISIHEEKKIQIA